MMPSSVARYFEGRLEAFFVLPFFRNNLFVVWSFSWRLGGGRGCLFEMRDVCRGNLREERVAALECARELVECARRVWVVFALECARELVECASAVWVGDVWAAALECAGVDVGVISDVIKARLDMMHRIFFFIVFLLLVGFAKTNRAYICCFG